MHLPGRDVLVEQPGGEEQPIGLGTDGVNGTPDDVVDTTLDPAPNERATAWIIGKPAKDLSIAESAMLIGLVKSRRRSALYQRARAALSPEAAGFWDERAASAEATSEATFSASWNDEARAASAVPAASAVAGSPP